MEGSLLSSLLTRAPAAGAFPILGAVRLNDEWSDEGSENESGDDPDSDAEHARDHGFPFV